jgi:uncharacterized membrane protein
MTFTPILMERPSAANSVHASLQAFPIACFSLTLVSDLAYMQTVNLLWLHFSEWLLLAGLVFGGFALLARLIDYFVRSVRPSWLAVMGGIVVLLLATLNSFVHTADGWTAVVPFGLALSILTVIAMMATGWFARRGLLDV